MSALAFHNTTAYISILLQVGDCVASRLESKYELKMIRRKVFTYSEPARATSRERETEKRRGIYSSIQVLKELMYRSASASGFLAQGRKANCAVKNEICRKRLD